MQRETVFCSETFRLVLEITLWNTFPIKKIDSSIVNVRFDLSLSARSNSVSDALRLWCVACQNR